MSRRSVEKQHSLRGAVPRRVSRSLSFGIQSEARGSRDEDEDHVARDESGHQAVPTVYLVDNRCVGLKEARLRGTVGMYRLRVAARAANNHAISAIMQHCTYNKQLELVVCAPPTRIGSFHVVGNEKESFFKVRT